MRRDRIEERLRALGLSQFEAAQRAGKNANFIYDYFTGKKKSFKGDGPAKLAQALECSIEYLTGEEDTPGEAPGGPVEIPIAVQAGGYVEAGAFRKVGVIQRPKVAFPAPIFPGYPPASQSAYVVRGDGFAARRIVEGDLLTVIDAKAAGSDLRSGALVVVEHTRLDGAGKALRESSVWELQTHPDRIELLPLDDTGETEPLVVRDGATEEPGSRAAIVGLVVSVYRRP